MNTGHPNFRFTLSARGIRAFKARLSTGQQITIGVRLIFAGLVLLPILISKNPIIDAVSVSIVVALIGWSVVSMLRLSKTKQLIHTYTILIDENRVMVDMMNTKPFFIARADISLIERTDEAFIVNGKKVGEAIIIPRDVDDPLTLRQVIGELEMDVRGRSARV